MKVLIAAPAAWLMLAAPGWAQQHQHQHEQMPPAAEQPAPEHDHSQMQHGDMQMGHGDHAAMERGAEADAHAAMMANMQGLYGPYVMGRDASGTAWQPDVSNHGGVHQHRGEWMLMTHALINAVFA